MPHKTSIGGVEIISLLDVGDWHLANFFPSADPQLWETYRSVYPEAQCDGNAICTSATAYAVRSGGSTVLVDAGLGPGPHERIGNQRGRLLLELNEAGIAPDAIELVIVTHLHHDHVGWNGIASAEGVRPTFPKARYLLPQKDWAYYQQPDMASRAAHLHNTAALYERGLVDLVDGEKTIGGHLTLVPTPGHTPGHQAVLVTSANERAMIIGDMAHTPAQVQETAWSPGADADPQRSARTRSDVFDRVEADGMLLCAGHFPHPGFGHLVRQDGRRFFQAL